MLTQTTTAQAYYAQSGPLTDAGDHAAALRALSDDPRALAQQIAALGIYDVVAPQFYAYDAPPDRTAEIHLRSAQAKLEQLTALQSGPLDAPRDPQQRLFCRCANFTQLYVTTLRAKGIPARSRCGFATYFNPGYHEDHWIAEVWDGARWQVVDAQFDPVWQAKIQPDFDIYDQPTGRFLRAGEAWTQWRQGELDADKCGIGFMPLYGAWFIANNLIRDVAALNKVEMLPWDNWGAMLQPDTELTEAQLAYFDDLAALTRDPDNTLDDVQARYASDDGLRVPEQVYNALTERSEAV